MTQNEIIEIAQMCKLIGMRPYLDGIYTESLVTFASLITVKALSEQERNFCSRCGKRTADLTTIHTCTPPQEKT